MSKHFVGEVTLETEECCVCGVTFAMPADLRQRFWDDHDRCFYCPMGHQQHYTGKTEKQRLREQLDRTETERNRAREEAQDVSRSYQKVRKRIRNGVCPCCNRTFENVARHMATKHADYGDNRQLRFVRDTCGLTQAQVAKEAAVSPIYISLFERGMELPQYAERAIRGWLDRQQA